MLLRHFVLSGELRFAQNRLQSPEFAIAHDRAEVFLRSQKGRSHPTPDHRAILPVGDAAGSDAHSGVRAFDDIGCRQASSERGRQAQPVDGKTLLQPLAQAGRSRWIFSLQPLCQLANARHARLGFHLPGCPHQALHLLLLLLGKVIEHIANLVRTAALAGRIGASWSSTSSPYRPLNANNAMNGPLLLCSPQS